MNLDHGFSGVQCVDQRVGVGCGEPEASSRPGQPPEPLTTASRSRDSCGEAHDTLFVAMLGVQKVWTPSRDVPQTEGFAARFRRRWRELERLLERRRRPWGGGWLLGAAPGKSSGFYNVATASSSATLPGRVVGYRPEPPPRRHRTLPPPQSVSPYKGMFVSRLADPNRGKVPPPPAVPQRLRRRRWERRRSASLELRDVDASSEDDDVSQRRVRRRPQSLPSLYGNRWQVRNRM